MGLNDVTFIGTPSRSTRNARVKPVPVMRAGPPLSEKTLGVMAEKLSGDRYVNPPGTVVTSAPSVTSTCTGPGAALDGVRT